MQLIIFTDLDDTLLDHHTYSFEEAKPALDMIKHKQIPLVLCTSKTLAETLHYQELLGIDEPFIVEDGGAIYIPKNYFGFEFEYQKEKDDYLIIELGTDYDSIRKALNDIKKQDLGITGFGDMTPEEIAQETGLTLEQAKLAAMREYDEPFRFKGDENRLKELIEKKGLRLSKGGRYYHITGDNDKGKAVNLLTDLFKKKYGKEKVLTMGIGDSENDFAMLDAVEEGYLVQRPDGIYASEKHKKTEGIGPNGFRWAVEKEVNQYLTSREHGKAL